jgi:hypothetical protein
MRVLVASLPTVRLFKPSGIILFPLKRHFLKVHRYTPVSIYSYIWFIIYYAGCIVRNYFIDFHTGVLRKFIFYIMYSTVRYKSASVVQFLATDSEARIRFPALPEKKVVGLEWGPVSLVSTTEGLRDRKVAAPV